VQARRGKGHVKPCCAISKIEGAQLLRDVFGGRAESFRRKAAAIKNAERSGRAADFNLVYGEYDLDLFLRLLDAATPRPGDVFVDLGSGCGRLVLASWMLYPGWKKCVGVEIVQELHAESISKYESLLAILREKSIPEPVAPVELMCGDFLEGGPKAADILFCYCTTWDSAGPVLSTLSRHLVQTLSPGSRVITTDKKLAEVCDESNRGFELIAEIEGNNADTFFSSGYVWRRVDRKGDWQQRPPPVASF